MSSELFDEILESMDFDYELNEDNKIKLIDLQGAYLGDIDEDEFELNENTCMNILDRLDVYINDYYLHDVNEVTGNDFETLAEALEHIKETNYPEYTLNSIEIIQNIIDPSNLHHRYEVNNE